jgi:hypothetical protein
MKNVTITMDEKVAEWARIEAARRNTSVSRMVGDMLAEKMFLTDAYQRTAQEWLAKDRTWKSEGKPYGSRADLYDRDRNRDIDRNHDIDRNR